MRRGEEGERGGSYQRTRISGDGDVSEHHHGSIGRSQEVHRGVGY